MRTVGGEVALHQMRCRSRRPFAQRRLWSPAPTDPRKARLGHQPSDTLATHPAASSAWMCGAPYVPRDGPELLAQGSSIAPHPGDGACRFQGKYPLRGTSSRRHIGRKAYTRPGSRSRIRRLRRNRSGLPPRRLQPRPFRATIRSISAAHPLPPKRSDSPNR